MLNVSKSFLVFLLCLNQQVCVIQEQVSFGDVTWFNRATFAMHLALKKKKRWGEKIRCDQCYDTNTWMINILPKFSEDEWSDAEILVLPLMKFLQADRCRRIWPQDEAVLVISSLLPSAEYCIGSGHWSGFVPSMNKQYVKNSLLVYWKNYLNFWPRIQSAASAGWTGKQTAL